MKAFVAACVFATIALCYAITLDQLKTDITNERHMLLTETDKTKVSVENEIHSTIQALDGLVEENKKKIANGSSDCKNTSEILDAVKVIYAGEEFFKECELERLFDNLRGHDFTLAYMYDRAVALESCTGPDCQSKIDEIERHLNQERKAISTELVHILEEADKCTSKQEGNVEIVIKEIMLYWQQCEESL